MAVNIVAPPGYQTEIAGALRTSVNTGSGASSYTVRILPQIAPFAARAGEATSIASGRIYWQAALGFLRNGESAGVLTIADAARSDWTTFFTPAGLSYENDSTDVYVNRVSGVIRQVNVPEAVVDVVTLSATSYELRYYHAAQAQGAVTSLRTFTGNPFVVYRIQQDGSATKLKITSETRTLASVYDLIPIVRSAYTTVERSGTYPACTWTLVDWTTVGQPPTGQEIRTWTGNGSGGHDETITVVSAYGGSPVRQITRSHTNYAWGDTPVSTTVGTTNSVTSTNSYYTNSAVLGSYGYPQSAGTTGGFTESYTYFDTTDDRRVGTVQTRTRPFLDTTGAEVTTFDYDLDAFGMLQRPTLVETKVNGVVTARSTTAYVQSQVNGLELVTATRQDSVSSGTTLTSVTKYFREDTYDAFFRNQPWSTSAPTGVKQSFVLQRGDWNGSAFTPAAGGLASLRASLTGLASNPGGATQVTQYSGYNLDPLWLVANQSGLVATYRDSYARVVRTENRVWDGSTWQLISWVNFAYNLSNQLVSRTGSDGGLYEAGYSGEFKLWERDETGIKVNYTYDPSGRLARTLKEGGVAGQGDLITDYTYDPADQVVRQETYGAGDPAERLVQTQLYDLAGRLVSSQPAGLGVTTYSYNPGARQKTATGPDGATRTEATYIDGQPFSVQGTAVVPEFYTHGVESDGRRYSQVNLGASGSARWSKAWTDWLGRPLRSERPGAPGQPVLSEQNTYSGALLTRTDRTASAPTLHYYDAFGRAVRSGLDVDLNGQLDAVGSDRYTESEQWIGYENGAWWQIAQTYTYALANSGTRFLTGARRERLSGLSDSLRAESRATDAEGNTTVRTVAVNRATRTVTATTTLPGYTNPQVETAVNGLGTATTAPDGLTFSRGYDALLRPATSTDPRTGTTVTAYYPGTTLVRSMTDPAGHVVGTTGYDLSGRAAWSRDNAGHNTLYAYNARGQLLRQWGDGATPASYTYNAYGERVTLSTYQAENNWGSLTWPGGTPTSTTTWTCDDASGVLTAKTDPAGRSVNYSYNSRGQLAQRLWARTRADGQRVSATYDYHGTTGELLSTTYNDGTPTVSATYTRLGQPDTLTDVTGVRDFIWNSAAPWRLSAEALPAYFQSRVFTPLYNEATGIAASPDYGPYRSSSVKGRQVGFQLGYAGNPAADLQQVGAISNLGRFVGVNTKVGAGTPRDFLYSYLAGSSLISSLSAGTFTLSRSYEGQRNLLTAIDGKWSTTSLSRHDYAYNGLRQRSAEAQGGAAFADYGEATHKTYTYDARGQVTHAVSYLGSNLADSSRPLPGRFFQFGYDAAGNRRSANHTGVEGLEDQFDVNALNQLTGRENNLVAAAGTVTAGAAVIVNHENTGRQGGFWSSEVLADNLAGPAATLVATIAAKNVSGSDLVRTDQRYAYQGPAYETLSYDLDGNLQGDGRWDYVWDAENRLVSMEAKAWTVVPNGPPRQRLEFAYDYQGRRVFKRVLNRSGSTWVVQSERKFLYDGWNLLAETDAAGTIQRSYTWGLDLTGSTTAASGVGALLQIADHLGGQQYFPTYDGNGNVTTLVRASDGVVAAIYEYNPFGELLRCQGSYAKTNPFRFSTKYTDDESGLVYYGYRYYSPSLGRFVCRDPIEESGGINLYTFVGNNAPNDYDFMGLTQESPDSIGGGGGGGGGGGMMGAWLRGVSMYGSGYSGSYATAMVGASAASGALINKEMMEGFIRDLGNGRSQYYLTNGRMIETYSGGKIVSSAGEQGVGFGSYPSSGGSNYGTSTTYSSGATVTSRVSGGGTGKNSVSTGSSSKNITPKSEITGRNRFVAFSKGYAGKFWAFGDPILGAGGDSLVDSAITASNYSLSDQAQLQKIANAGKAFGNINAMIIQMASLGMAAKFAPVFEVKSERPTYLYEMVGPGGVHLKYGVTIDPLTRYSPSELANAQLKILTEGPRPVMLYLERALHETMPIGPREGQNNYIQIQLERGYIPPSQYPIWSSIKK